MAQRNSSLLLTLALVAGAAYLLLPAQESFAAPPQAHGALRAGPVELAQGFEDAQGRLIQVSMAAGNPSSPPQNENQVAGPRGLNLLFVGLLGGTAAIGLLALFFYGAYSGTGSSI